MKNIKICDNHFQRSDLRFCTTKKKKKWYGNIYFQNTKVQMFWLFCHFSYEMLALMKKLWEWFHGASGPSSVFLVGYRVRKDTSIGNNPFRLFTKLSHPCFLCNWSWWVWSGLSCEWFSCFVSLPCAFVRDSCPWCCNLCPVRKDQWWKQHWRLTTISTSEPAL